MRKVSVAVLLLGIFYTPLRFNANVLQCTVKSDTIQAWWTSRSMAFSSRKATKYDWRNLTRDVWAWMRKRVYSNHRWSQVADGNWTWKIKMFWAL